MEAVVNELPEFKFTFTLEEAEMLNEFIKHKSEITTDNDIRIRYHDCVSPFAMEWDYYMRNKIIDIDDATKAVGKTTSEAFWRASADRDEREKVAIAITEAIRMAKEWHATKMGSITIDTLIRNKRDKYFAVRVIHDKEKSLVVYEISIISLTFMSVIKDNTIKINECHNYTIRDEVGSTYALKFEEARVASDVKTIEDNLTHRLRKMLNDILNV